jgi:hypothetical protein
MIGVITYGNVPAAACRDSLLWFKQTPSRPVFSELEEVYGKDVISQRAVEKRTVVFDGGRPQLVNLPRSGRPRDTGKIDAVPGPIKSDGCLSQKKTGGFSFL